MEVMYFQLRSGNIAAQKVAFRILPSSSHLEQLFKIAMGAITVFNFAYTAAKRS
jgi:hypothetical protein